MKTPKSEPTMLPGVTSKKRLTVKELSEQTDARFDEILARLDALQTTRPANTFITTIMTSAKNVYRYMVSNLVMWIIILFVIWVVAPNITPFKSVPIKHTDKPVSVSLTMSQQEYNLLQSAVSLVLNDLDEHKTIGSALTALYGELPTTIRDKVIDQLGDVKNPTELPDAMQTLLGRIIITNP
jgi:hypothetical protein